MKYDEMAGDRLTVCEQELQLPLPPLVPPMVRITQKCILKLNIICLAIFQSKKCQ